MYGETDTQEATTRNACRRRVVTEDAAVPSVCDVLNAERWYRRVHALRPATAGYLARLLLWMWMQREPVPDAREARVLAGNPSSAEWNRVWPDITVLLERGPGGWAPAEFFRHWATLDRRAETARTRRAASPPRNGDTPATSPKRRRRVTATDRRQSGDTAATERRQDGDVAETSPPRRGDRPATERRQNGDAALVHLDLSGDLELQKEQRAVLEDSDCTPDLQERTRIPAYARATLPALTKLAHGVLAEVHAGTLAVDELGAALKDRAAAAHLSWAHDPDLIRAALASAEAQRHDVAGTAGEAPIAAACRVALAVLAGREGLDLPDLCEAAHGVVQETWPGARLTDWREAVLALCYRVGTYQSDPRFVVTRTVGDQVPWIALAEEAARGTD